MVGGKVTWRKDREGRILGGELLLEVSGYPCVEKMRLKKET